MNAIAQQLGQVGLPAPIAELAAKDWDVIVVGGGAPSPLAPLRNGDTVPCLRDGRGGDVPTHRPLLRCSAAPIATGYLARSGTLVR